MKKFLFIIAALLCAVTTNLFATEGALNGKFTVNADGKKVYFSQGNLQYQPSTTTYRFATNQYDYVGNDTYGNVYEGGVKSSNENFKRETYTGWGDSYCWGTGDNPWYHSEDASEFGTFVDWGSKPISNGGNAANLWRTLTEDEWNYLAKSRPNASTLHCVAKVGDVNCHLIFPDDWTGIDGITFDFTADECETNTITLAQWPTLEAAGVVCLPLAGFGRMNIGTIEIDDINSEGFYWSATSTGNSAKFVQIFSYDNTFEIGGSMFKNDGASVRLVQDVPDLKVTILPSTGGTITVDEPEGLDLNAVPYGTEITFLATADEENGYEVANGDAWTNATAMGNYIYAQTTVTSDTTISCAFTLKQYEVRFSAAASSSLAPAPDGTHRAPMAFSGGHVTCQAIPTSGDPVTINNGDYVDHGTLLRFTADVDAPGLTFDYWSNGATSGKTQELVLTEDINLVAYFKEAQSFTLTMQDDGNGVVTIFNGTPGEEVYSADPIPVFEGTELYLTAHPNIGYEFDHWDNYSAPVWNEEAEEWIAPTMTGNLTVKAYFRSKGAQPELAEGELPGLFTVGKDDEGNPIRVRFSKGNLQYIAGDGKTHKVADESIAETSSARRGTWQFAENQIDYIGDKNNQAAEDYNKPIDIFCYGASGYDNRYPWLKTTTVLRQDLDSTNYDFGVFNAISNGGNEPGLWRMLNQHEMTVLLYNRNDHTHLYGYGRQLHGIGTADDVTGLFLMPDGWVMPGELAKENITFLPLAVKNFTTNKYTAAQWAILEQSGVVFIPAGGARYDMGSGTTMYAVGQAVYNQLSTYSEGGMAYAMGAMVTIPGEFDGGTIIGPFPAGDGGCSVRLVRNVPAAPEGIEQPTSDSSLKERGQKVLRNGQLFIIRQDGAVFNALGERVK